MSRVECGGYNKKVKDVIEKRGGEHQIRKVYEEEHLESVFWAIRDEGRHGAAAQSPSLRYKSATQLRSEAQTHINSSCHDSRTACIARAVE